MSLQNLLKLSTSLLNGGLLTATKSPSFKIFTNPLRLFATTSTTTAKRVWSESEDKILLKEYAKYGNQWSKIEIPSRNSQAIGVRYRSEAFQRKYHDKLLAIFNHFKEQRLGHPVEKPVSLPWKSRTELAHEKKLKKLEKSEKSEKSKSKPAKSTKSTKSAKSTKATKPTKSAKSTKTTKTTKAKTISSKPQRKVATKSK